MQPIFCHICGSENVTFVEDLLKDGFQIFLYKCRECEVIFSIKESNQCIYDYSQEKTHDRMEIYQVIDLIEILLQAHNGKSVNVLEVGCGDLRHLIKLNNIFKNEEIRLYGFDLNYTQTVRETAKKENITLINSIGEIQKNSIDIIFLFHVLEHVDKPVELVLSLKEKLSENGYIVISVPNDMRVSKLIFKEGWDYPPYHNYRFSGKTFEFIARLSNLKLVELKRYNIKLKYDFYIFVEGVKESLYDLIIKVKRNLTFTNKDLNLGSNDKKELQVANKTCRYSLYRKYIDSLLSIVSYFVALFIIFGLKLFSLHKNGSLSMVAVFRKCTLKESSRVVVFDFDGTIIKEDSYVEYLRWVSRKKLMKLIIILLSLIFRLKLIDNKLFKVITWRISYGRNHNKRLNIQKFIDQTDWQKNFAVLDIIEAVTKSNSKLYVISATPAIIVSEFFKRIFPDLYPNIVIFGSNPLLPINTLLANVRHDGKRKLVKILGIDYIDDFYTNSIEEDEPLFEISKNTKLVRLDGKVEIYTRL